jgi:RNA polymerase sigma factor (sigma-70 family)
MTVDSSEAFALFFKNNSGPVFRALLAGTLNRAAAEDATAEAFARAFAHWDTVAAHPNPRAWVLRVAWNCYRSSWRKWESRWSADPPEPIPIPGPRVDPDLVAAIRGLPQGQREEMFGLGDPVIRRLQQAFVNEAPATELAAIMQRAAQYQAGEPPETDDAPPPHHDLTAADLVAARRREPAAVTRIYTAYEPALFRFFMASVGDRHQAEDPTGNAFLSAIESLPRFRGPIEALGGWLFQIARHDLYDHRRRQARSRLEPLEDNLDEAAVAVGASEVLGNESGTELDGEGVAPQPMPPPLSRRPLNDTDDEIMDSPLNRLSPREREVLALLGRGWSNAQIGRELSISPHTVRTHIQNLLQKLGMHSKLEAATLAMQQPSASAAEYRPVLATELLEDARVLAALGQLPADQREVLLLRMAGGLTAPEVAAILGKTTGAVKALHHRGLASLAKVLGPQSTAQTPERPFPAPDPDHLARQEKHQK